MFSSEYRSKSEPLGMYCLARPFVFSLAPLFTITFHLTAHGALAYSYYLGDGGHRHRPLQHHGYCVPLLRRQVIVFQSIFWRFLRLQRYILPAKSLSSDRLYFFLGGYICNQTSRVALSISFRVSMIQPSSFFPSRMKPLLPK